jgi:3-oxoacyl-[acyl-carrier protein] reductase
MVVNNTGGPPSTLASGQDPALWAEHFNARIPPATALSGRVPPGMHAARWRRVVAGASSGVGALNPNLGTSNALRSPSRPWRERPAIRADGGLIDSI